MRVEYRKKNSPADKEFWFSAGFGGEFSSRIYGMFARMACVRTNGSTYKVQFEPRGFPKNTNIFARENFYMFVSEDKEAAYWNERYCTKEDADRWVEAGYSEWVDDKHLILTNPDHHSASWLTTRELRQCFDDCFKEEDGSYKSPSDYIEWLGLVSLCEGLESDGRHECRVVFAFDN